MDKNRLYIKTKSKGFAEVDFNYTLNSLYEKRGNKYVGAMEHINYIDYFREGDYLISVRPNGRTTTSRLYARSSSAELEALVKDKRDAICKAVKEHMRMHPAEKKLTKKQVCAWHAFDKAMGNMRYCVQYDSLAELYEKVEKVLLGKESG